MTAKRAVEIDDLFEIQLLNEPVTSPDGKRVAYTVTNLDRDENTYRAAIWLLDLDSGTQRRLTNGQHRDRKPTWSPDGKTLYFTSDRKMGDEAGGQIWQLPLAGGEPTKLTSLDEAVEEFAVSPNGKQIAVVSRVREEDPNPDSDVRVIRTVRYRFDGEGYLDDKYRQIFIVDADSGEARQLTEGTHDHRSVAWAPTGYELAFSANLDEDWEFSSVRDIYVMRLPSGTLRKVTDGSGRWSSPSWSSDGSKIACYGTQNLDRGFARSEIYVLDARGGEPRSITADFDRSFSDGAIADLISFEVRPPIWSDDGSQLTVVYSDQGSVRAANVNVESGDVSTLTTEGQRVGVLNRLPNGDLVYLVSTPINPSDLYRLKGGKPERLTDINADWRQQVVLNEPEPFTVDSTGGRKVDCWLLTPPGFDSSQKYPLLLEIHGGPFGMYGETMMHEFHVLAGHGYLVLYTNPCGSVGYGDAYALALGQTWGEADMPDLMAAVDEVVSRGYVDEQRMGVLGGSYGGFMTNWVVGHTDRFAAAVTQRTISDLYSAWGTDDIMFADNNTTFGGPPWERDEHYRKYSPITYVDQVSTPVLLIQSEEDYRCPMGQAEEFYIALKLLGQTAELVRFPNESHGLSRGGQPKHRVERLQYITGWFDTYA